MEPPEIWANEPDLERLRAANAVLGSDPRHALTIFQDLEKRGSIMSLVYIGHMFENGLGVKQDLSASERYYRRAYEGGSTSGLFSLGAVYWKSGDYVRAEQMFLRGSERRDPRSLYWLACIYLNKTIDNGRYEKAATLLEQAYSMGHIQSGRRLGRLLMTGRFGLLRKLMGLRLIISAAIAGAKIAVLNPSDERVKDLPI